MATPRLWSWRVSPFAGKVRVAFAEKGVEVELVEIDPRSRPARLWALNPTGRVPVLELGEVAIRESTPICEWLEESHPDPPLWPADASARAVARGLLRWIDDELTLNFFLSMRKERFGLERSDHPDIIAILRERLVRRWPTLEELLSLTGGPWLLDGDSPTLADLAALPLAVRLPAWKPELGPPVESTRTAVWLEALRRRPSASEVDRRGERVGDA
ncbi:MAG TPA: glutathione S-transferase family protein [Solirubrobacteraceae bacterium]|nr:glutathione S-transferase family protein [Solirubrobacteraceae bacterium]